MNAAEFETASIALLRTAVGWQAKIARMLPSLHGGSISDRQVRRWVEADSVPDWAAEKLREMMIGDSRMPWPRDEWVLGDAKGEDGRMREYIVHLQPPRFSARVVEVGEDEKAAPEHQPADVSTGAVYHVDAITVICEVDWIDQPRAGEITQLLEAAANYIDGIDQ